MIRDPRTGRFTTREVVQILLDALLAAALVEEATREEDLAWANADTDGLEAAVAATELRMRGEALEAKIRESVA